ncbi:MAG TPA: hypothetical protein DD414_02290 [Lachnospiraceae bacterium]|nr:hypothetical protein [Lachnospiraceae bacterium]
MREPAKNQKSEHCSFKRKTVGYEIFFAALALFIVFLNSMILIVSIVILKDKLSAVRDKCLAEHYVLASSLLGDMQALERRGNNVVGNIDKLMRLYARYLQGKGNELAVAFSGEWIYESAAFVPVENMIFPPDTGYSQERLVYMENGSRPVLCVYGSFPVPWQDYGLMYMGDLSDTIQSWRQTKNILFLMGVVVMLMMSFFLFQFLDIIFRPLRQISCTSEKIANGNYDSRILVYGKDEISNVAYNFNLMAEQVETQIQQLEDAAEQKQQFIDNFSHELRIPLTAIYGYAEYIQKAAVSEEEIRVSSYAEESHIVVEVEDHGIGMEEAQISHIKEAFYRVDQARSRAAGGAGLGLAICERIIQIHHADMSFISEPGTGTTVKLSFPV